MPQSARAAAMLADAESRNTRSNKEINHGGHKTRHRPYAHGARSCGIAGYRSRLGRPGPGAQGADDFLNDINSIGIGSRDDPHNFDLVGFGNAICWRLYSSETPGHIADELVTGSRSNDHAALTHDQASSRRRLCNDGFRCAMRALIGY